ncbi:phosphate metabolism protein 7, variant 2 [Basidiobolus ranarum]
MMSTDHQNSPMASTILVTGIPHDTNNIQTLQEMFDVFPGGVRHICINRNIGKLEKDINNRTSILGKLESAETKLIKAGMKDPSKPPQRPTHKTGFIPCCGEKVDSIEYYREELAQLNQVIVMKQKNLDQYTPESSAFITFNNQLAAHLAAQSLAHNMPLAMEAKYVEVSPDDVVWGNLGMFSIERSIRKIIALAMVIALVILWFIPTAFVQSIANLDTLTKFIPFLSVIDSWPASVKGIITGVLPSVALAILMAVLPMILRALIKFEGTVRHSDIELSLMNKYFFFLVVNVFFVTLVSGPIFNVIEKVINGNFDPAEIATTISSNLPKASVFFISYVLLQTFIGASKEILQGVPLVLRYVMRFVLASTPRKLSALESLPGFVWGTSFPQHTLIFVVGIAFATIAPILLPFIAAYFGLYYLVYCHQFQYVYGSNTAQTGGLFYPRAVNHMFTGIYIFHVCVLCQFFIAQAYAQGIVQVVLLIITIIVNIFGKRGFSPLLKYLPLNIAVDPTPLGLTEGNMAYKKESSPQTQPGDVDLERQGFIDNSETPVGYQPNIPNGEKHEANNFNSNVTQANGGANPPVNFVSAKHEKLSIPNSSANSHTSSTRRKAFSFSVHDGANEVYLHPALRDPVPTVWIPQDSVGLSDREVFAMDKQLIPATNEGAHIDEAKGHIVLTKHDGPPNVVQSEE